MVEYMPKAGAETEGAAYVNTSPGLGALVPTKSAVTVTSTLPEAPAGTVAVIVVAEINVNAAETAPKCTAVALLKLVPVMVTSVPAGPLAGLTAVTTGVAPPPNEGRG